MALLTKIILAVLGMVLVIFGAFDGEIMQMGAGLVSLFIAFLIQEGD